MGKGKYVLKARTLAHQDFSDGYYTGKSYIYQGSKYAVVNRNILDAKIYTSETRAIKACEMEFENYRFDAEKIPN